MRRKFRSATSVIAFSLLAACAENPEVEKKQSLAAEYLMAKKADREFASGVKVFTFDNHEQPPLPYDKSHEDEISSKGFAQTRYVLVDNTDADCYAYYFVYEKCGQGLCEYEFVLSSELCE